MAPTRNNPSMHGALSMAAAITRWLARSLSALILLFWGFFIVAYLVGGEEGSSRPLATSDYVALGTIGVWLVGLAVAWKWELTGGAMALGAVMVCAVINWRVLLFPGTFIPVAALLFMLSWWMRRCQQRNTAIRHSTRSPGEAQRQGAPDVHIPGDPSA